VPAINATTNRRFVRKKAKPRPKPAPTPRPRPVRLVQRGHASEGPEVLKPRRLKSPRGTGDRKGNEEFKRGQSYVKGQYDRYKRGNVRYISGDPKYHAGTTVQPDTAAAEAQRRRRVAREADIASKTAPVLKALEQTTRPLHGVAAGTRAAIKGQNVPKALLRGVQNKDKSTFSDVLKDVGVPKAIRGPAGFALDVAADPTTYVSFGASSVARKAALDAGRRAERKALSKGLTKEQARKFADRAAKRTEQQAPRDKGVAVRVAGRDVPGVTKATAKATRPVRKVVRRATPERTRAYAKGVIADVNPNVTAAGATRAESKTAIRATRTARAKANRGRDAAQKQALGLRKQLGEDNYSRVIDALESGTVKSLPAELRHAAVHVRSHLRYANRLRKQAGIRGGERKNYVPHQLTEQTLEAEGKKVGGVGSKVVRPTSSRARVEQRSLKELRAAEPGRYSENLPELFANRMTEGHVSVAKAELNRRLAGMGRDVKKGMDLPDGSGTQAVFHIKASDIRQVTDRKELARLADQGGKTGRYVILNRDIVKRSTEGVRPEARGTRHRSRVRQGDLRVQAGRHRHPGLPCPQPRRRHQHAYIGQSGRRLPGNLVRSGRVLKAAGRQDKANLSLTHVSEGKGTLKTRQYGTITYDEAARQLAKHGAFRTGYTAKELPELAASGSSKVRVRGIVPQSLKRLGLNREDLPRLATAVEALRNGATWEEAAQHVATYHFDYQHLTNFERQVGRRLAPFYTWSARNIPLQARSFFQKPGKYAQYQKLREEASKVVGTDQQDARTRDLYDQLREAGVRMPRGWEKYLSEWEQRNAGVPVSWKGHKFTVSLGLPFQDLNEFPGFADGQAQEYFQKAMSLMTPLMKNPVEYFSNHSASSSATRSNGSTARTSRARYVSGVPGLAEAKIGVVKIIDKRSGKMVWGVAGEGRLHRQAGAGRTELHPAVHQRRGRSSRP
jgi:hypothetical protein